MRFNLIFIFLKKKNLLLFLHVFFLLQFSLKILGIKDRLNKFLQVMALILRQYIKTGMEERGSRDFSSSDFRDLAELHKCIILLNKVVTPLSRGSR